MLDRIYRWIMPDNVDVMPHHLVPLDQVAYQLRRSISAQFQRYLAMPDRKLYEAMTGRKV